MTFLAAPFVGRENLPAIFNQRGYQRGCEIGVHRGGFSHEILNAWGGKLYGVDHYPANYHPNDPAAKGDRAKDREAALSRLARFGDRFVHVNQPSPMALDKLPLLDFVYIDGNHDYFMDDFWRAWESVKHGGMIAGHDIVCTDDNENWGELIQRMLLDFGRDVYLVPESDIGANWSFYLFKDAT